MTKPFDFMGSLLVTVFFLSAITAPGKTSMETATAWSSDPAALRAECDRLHDMGPHCFGGYQILNAFIDQLSAARDEGALRLIITEEMPGVSYAAVCYAELLGPRKGIQFTRLLRPCSRGWRSMLWTLSSSNGPEIRAYLREMILAPGLRDICYELDYCNGRGDFVEAAWADLDSTDRIYEGMWADGHLGDLARDYLERFEKNRPIPPQRFNALSP